MRLVLGLLLLMAGALAAEAKGPRVERIEVVDTGYIKVGKFKTIKDDDISTGQRSEASRTKITRSTTDIVAKVGDVFGADFKIIGPPKGQKVTLTVVWRYPEPGIKEPDKSGPAKKVDTYEDEFTVGGTATLYWSLATDWVIVPGTWTAELWSDGRKLMTQSFEVSRSDDATGEAHKQPRRSESGGDPDDRKSDPDAREDGGTQRNKHKD